MLKSNFSTPLFFVNLESGLGGHKVMNLATSKPPNFQILNYKDE